MDVDVLVETVIDRPVPDVAAFAGDPARAPVERAMRRATTRDLAGLKRLLEG